MAVAYKCDRCGSFYTDSDLGISGLMYYLHINPVFSPSNGRQHLCSNCSDSLSIWFNNPEQPIPKMESDKKKRWWQK